MRVRIDFEATDPPQGLIASEDAGPTIRFAGWLGLVTSLEELLTPSLQPSGLRKEMRKQSDDEADERGE